MVVIELGGSKSQCGQSEANSSCVSAFMASKVDSSSFMLLLSSGWEVKYISRMYSLGGRLSMGASHTRIMNSWSSRCMMKGTQASPLSTQTSLSFGKRSGRPLITQLVR